MPENLPISSRRQFFGDFTQGLTIAAAATAGMSAATGSLLASEPAVPASDLLKKKTRLSLAAYSWNARLAKGWDEKTPPRSDDPDVHRLLRIARPRWLRTDKLLLP